MGKYNFPSSDAFVGEKQTTFVDFAGFTPFLQTYCHNVQNVSQAKNIADINLNHSCLKCYPAKTEIVYFSFYKFYLASQAISPQKRLPPQGVS